MGTEPCPGVPEPRAGWIVPNQPLEGGLSSSEFPPVGRSQTQTEEGIVGIRPAGEFQNEPPVVQLGNGRINREPAPKPETLLPIGPVSGVETEVPPALQGLPGLHDLTLSHEELHLTQRSTLLSRNTGKRAHEEPQAQKDRSHGVAVPSLTMRPNNHSSRTRSSESELDLSSRSTLRSPRIAPSSSSMDQWRTCF